MKQISTWIGLVVTLLVAYHLYNEITQEQARYESIEQDYVDATHWQTKLGNAWQLEDESRKFTTAFVTHFDASHTAVEAFTNRGADFLKLFLDDFVGQKQYKAHLHKNKPADWWEASGQFVKEQVVGAVVDDYDYRNAIRDAKGPFTDSLWKYQNDFDIPIIIFSYEAIDTLFGVTDPVSDDILQLASKYNVIHDSGPLPTLEKLERQIDTYRSASNQRTHRLGGYFLIVILLMGGLVWIEVKQGRRYSIGILLIVASVCLYLGLTQTLVSNVLILEKGSLSMPSIKYTYSVTQQSLGYEQSMMLDLISGKMQEATKQPLLLILLLITSLGLIIVPLYQIGKMILLVLTGTVRHFWLDHLLSLKWIDMMVFYTIVYSGFQLYNSTTPRVREGALGLQQMSLEVGASLGTITTIQLGFISFILFGLISWMLRTFELLLTKKIRKGLLIY